MSLTLATIPEDPARLAAWLDVLMIDGRIGSLAAELAEVHGNDQSSATLTSQLEPLLPAIRTRGLTALPRPVLQALMTSPANLLELQGQILVEPGSYWEKPTAEVKSSSRVRISFAVMALAACLLAAFSLGVFQPTPQPWGWAKGLPDAPDGKAYLLALADQAQDWGKKQPADAAALKQRLNEFQAGCQVLINADHPKLNAQQSAWLKEKCRKWSGDIDALAKSIDAGTPAATVQQQADELVNRLTNVLRSESGKM